MTVDGGARADVAVGEEVDFAAVVEAPPGTGTIVSRRVGLRRLRRVRGELDGRSTVRAAVLRVTAAHTFTEPGTYFPALRVRTQRHSDMRKPHARIENLGRVRVVVE